MNERLQKLLARAGHGSRRSAEALITSGRVTVNGALVTTLGAQADPDVDEIAVDGTVLSFAAEQVYLAMHKPDGVVTTARDPQGRTTVMDLLPAALPPHVLPIGRLDRDTEGLLLFTNDGEFAHRLSHPRYEIEKEYLALVVGLPDEKALAQLRAGVDIGEHVTAAAQADVAAPPHGHEARPGHSWVRLVIHEGRKRQVRIMCSVVGHGVRALVRTRVGEVRLGRLERGATRALTAKELDSLRKAVGLDV
jgi:pseudouridine synthase